MSRFAPGVPRPAATSPSPQLRRCAPCQLQLTPDSGRPSVSSASSPACATRLRQGATPSSRPCPKSGELCRGWAFRPRLGKRFWDTRLRASLRENGRYACVVLGRASGTRVDPETPWGHSRSRPLGRDLVRLSALRRLGHPLTASVADTQRLCRLYGRVDRSAPVLLQLLGMSVWFVCRTPSVDALRYRGGLGPLYVPL